MKYLLDTNTCINVMRNHPGVLQHISVVPPGDCAISTVTSYELYTGAAKCAAPNQERNKIDLLLQTIAELPFDQTAARSAGALRALLEAKGQMIGPYDVLLAAQALVLGLTFVTANMSEFQRVPGLIVVNWQDAT